MYVLASRSQSLCRLAGALILLAAAAFDATAQKIVHQREINDEYELFILDVPSGVSTPLTTAEILPGSKWEPRWSPDGMRVAFSVTTKGGRQPSSDSDRIVYVIHADGSGLTAFADSDGQDLEPRWSPDGI
ncbi:MAG: hypothetical protein O2795_11820 [Acidobacteria bacterium]|nr:hypothetical protein [Acidobacteriota bacterium]